MASDVLTRCTPEDLLAIADRPMPELIAGELMERPPTGQHSDLVGAAILALLWNFAHAHRLGFVNGSSCGYQIFPHDSNRVRLPDVSFTRAGRLPGDKPYEGHSKVAPDLVVEVISPNDLAVELEAKIDDYLRAGVPLIWVVEPKGRTVRVHRGDGSGTFLRAEDVLDGGAVLPGFSCRIAEFFD
jgi:Uma2 family endonuclease